MRVVLFSFLMFSVSFFTFGQKLTYKGFPSLVWPTLYSVDYVKSPDTLGFQKPIFSQKIKALEGKKIVLPGYIVPFSDGLMSKTFMLSSLPLNACFFCGVGGAETVVQVITSEPVRYTDKPVEIEGILRLNDSDPEKMIYILEKAETLGELEF